MEGIDDCNTPVSARDLCIQENVRQQQLSKFWKLWSNDYIRNLPPCVKGFVPRCNLRKGSVVMIREDNVPRMSWPIGIVMDVFPSKDNVIRSVKIKTSRGMICRPVQRLHDLEISYTDSEATNIEKCSDNVKEPNAESPCIENTSEGVANADLCPVSRTRSGRSVKPPSRLNL